jgi:hypothetical protein
MNLPGPDEIDTFGSRRGLRIGSVLTAGQARVKKRFGGGNELFHGRFGAKLEAIGRRYFIERFVGGLLRDVDLPAAI